MNKRRKILVSVLVLSILTVLASAFAFRSTIVAEYYRTQLSSKDSLEVDEAIEFFMEKPHARALPELFDLFVSDAGNLSTLRKTAGGMETASSKVFKALFAGKDHLRPTLLRKLRSADARNQFWSLFLLQRFGSVPNHMVERLTELSSQASHPLVRAHAVHVLGSMQPSGEMIVDAITRALEDDDEQVRYIALFALYEFGTERQPGNLNKAKNVIQKLTSDSAERIRRLASVLLDTRF